LLLPIAENDAEATHVAGLFVFVALTADKDELGDHVVLVARRLPISSSDVCDIESKPSIKY